MIIILLWIVFYEVCTKCSQVNCMCIFYYFFFKVIFSFTCFVNVCLFLWFKKLTYAYQQHKSWKSVFWSIICINVFILIKILVLLWGKCIYKLPGGFFSGGRGPPRFVFCCWWFLCSNNLLLQGDLTAI